MVTLQLEAVLKDINGNPLSGKPINFYYSYDQETWNLIATVNTDSNGKATATHETTKTTYYKAVFEGDDVYESSSALRALILIEGATVEIYRDGELIATLTTDINGEASITLETDSYTVKVMAEGFEPHEQTINLTSDMLKEVVLQKVSQNTLTVKVYGVE